MICSFYLTKSKYVQVDRPRGRSVELLGHHPLEQGGLAILGFTKVEQGLSTIGSM